MNNNKNTFRLVPMLMAAVLLSACAGGPKGPPPEVARLQAEVDRLRADSRISTNADNELREAERAVDVLVMEGPRMRRPDYEKNLYLTDRLVQIAEAEGLARYAEERAEKLGREREGLLIESRTREANAARSAAEAALLSAEDARMRAEEERRAAMLAREEAEAARRQLADMEAKLADLEAKQTDRGLVVTLGDVLFEVDRAELKPGAMRNLQQLADALQRYPETEIAIEGHTDSTGSHEYNQGLSERRAATVRNFLAGQGVGVDRLATLGLGETQPVAPNSTSAGRQQNRRVEVVIQNDAGSVVQIDQ